MTDILIKGMEMPKGCTYEDNNGKPKICFMFNDCDLDRSRCPLVEIPPHGRLIDADKLIQYLLTIEPRNETIGTCVKCEIKDLENAPTVLERNYGD